MAVVQPQHVVSIYDEQGIVKLSTTACGVHVPEDITVQRAAMRLTAAAEDDDAVASI
jgi:hypothetical protein